jgi:hypothetical protein
MRLPALFAILCSLLVSGCVGGVKSTKDVSAGLTPASPIREGSYVMIGSDDGVALLSQEPDGSYRFRNPKDDKEGLSFRVLSMPELPATRYLVQAIDEENADGTKEYRYYFMIAAGDQIIVLTPSKYELEEAHLSDALKPLVEIRDNDEVIVSDAENTLDVLKALTKSDVEVIMQLVRQP